MAQMIPVDGPLGGSHGERSVFYLLQAQLSDDFIVIHSLPWLAEAVKDVDPAFAPTGEIDFLVLHPKLGALSLEVKAGIYKVQGSIFTLVRTGTRVDIAAQMRRNHHGLARWLGGAGTNWKIGYGWVFTDTSLANHPLPPAIADLSQGHAERIALDRGDMPKLGMNVQQLMTYWKRVHRNPDLGSERLQRLIDALCPNFDGTPTWAVRAATDAAYWLRLTPDQSKVVERVCRGERTVVTGWPGTGKTLIGIEMARRLAAQGYSVLMLTFNTPLADYLRTQLQGLPGCHATNWHRFCGEARRELGRPGSAKDEAWLERTCAQDLADALDASTAFRFDAVIVDEAQALRPEWIELLVQRVCRNQLALFCDETQRFTFERFGASLGNVLQISNVPDAFHLTQVARMPRAVTDRLLSTSDVSVQITSPRELEVDTLQERVQHESMPVLDCIQDLLLRGFKPAEIVVLTPSIGAAFDRDSFKHLGIAVETVARFRGLEAPAVIIADASGMSDAERFCAYSRATTLCVAFYDAEQMAWADDSRFQPGLRQNTQNCALMDQARAASLAQAVVERASNPRWLATRSIRIGWSDAWCGWVMERDANDEDDSHLIEHITEQHDAPIYFWRAGSRRDFFAAHRSASVGGTPGFTGSLLALVCEQCCEVTPHERSNHSCISCAHRSMPPPKPLEKMILATDRLLNDIGRGRVDASQIKELPPALAALTLLRSARTSPSASALPATAPGGVSRVYRLAGACVMNRLARSQPSQPIQSHDLSKQSHAWLACLSTVPLPQWHQAISSAFGVLYQRQYVEKLGTGIYCLSQRIRTGDART